MAAGREKRPAARTQRQPILQRFGGAGAWPFAFPLVVAAQARLVFFHLYFELAEGLFASGAHVFAEAGGMERPSRQGQIQ
jgi:hypothetical protein